MSQSKFSTSLTFFIVAFSTLTSSITGRDTSIIGLASITSSIFGASTVLLILFLGAFLALTSLITGAFFSTEEVDSIEDVASALKFDPDAAEGLAFVAGSVTINIDHKSLNSSSSLNKLCIKMGIEQSVIAALLGILNQDYQAGAGKSKTLFVVKTLLLYNTCLQLKTILMNVCFLLQLSMLS